MANNTIHRRNVKNPVAQAVETINFSTVILLNTFLSQKCYNIGLMSQYSEYEEIQIPLETAISIEESWLRAIKNNENGIVIFHFAGYAYRLIKHLLNTSTARKAVLGSNYSKYAFTAESVKPMKNVDVDSFLKELLLISEVRSVPNIPTIQTTTKAIENQFSNYISVTFMLYETDNWFTDGRSDILSAISAIAEHSTKIQFLLFCETNITSPEVLPTSAHTTKCLQNLFIHPLLGDEQMSHYLKAFRKLWGIPITNDEITKIQNCVGNHTLLLKEALRIYMKRERFPGDFLHEPTMRIKLENLWQKMNFSEKNVLRAIIKGKQISNPVEINSFNFLNQIGFVDTNSDNTAKINLPILSKFISEKITTSQPKIDGRGRIMVDGLDISHHFGQKEYRFIFTLLKKRGEEISRENMGHFVFSKDDYSDWALDRLVSRIRRKLKNLDIQHKIKTVRKFGWVWET